MTTVPTPSATLSLDKRAAAQFLELLDPEAEKFTFQFFKDDAGGHAEVIHAPWMRSGPRSKR